MIYSQKSYWFNIKLGKDFEHGPGVYASWVNLVLLEDGTILWEDFDIDHYKRTGEDKIVWNTKPEGIGFDHKDEIVAYVEGHGPEVAAAVIKSFENSEHVCLYGDFSVWCHGHYDVDGSEIE